MQLRNAWLQGFVRPSSRDMLVCGNSPADVLDQLEAFQRECSRVKACSECMFVP